MMDMIVPMYDTPVRNRFSSLKDSVGDLISGKISYIYTYIIIKYSNGFSRAFLKILAIQTVLY